jgi:hypothetical protein
MRMKARPGLHYAPVPGGVYLAGVSTQFVMRGSDLLFTVADVCVPLLEDGATEDDLVTALGSEHARPAVRHLTEGLRTRGLLLEPGRLTVPEPPATVREQHAESLALLESVCADPYAAFAALRAATVALAGPPEATGPAARGLIRAGAGRVVVTGTAGEDMPEDADAMLVCVGAGDEPAPPEPDGRPVMIVPVVLDGRLLLAGPVIRDGTSLRTWSALRARALAWADPAAGPPRPVADALAGALAAQLLFETLAGVAGGVDAHVVHGADLAAERVTVRRADAQPQVWRRLGDSEPAPVPDVEEAVDLTGTVTAQWTGLVALAPGDSLPQMPLALREARYGGARPGSVVAWGADQESATVAVTLAALRQSAGAPPDRDSPGRDSRDVTGAAGLTEDAWLLDGALRLLADRTLPLHAVPVDSLDPEAMRFWREIQRAEPGQYAIEVRHVPGLGWLLGRVESARTGETLGLAWGPDEDTAIQRSLGTALARVQVRAVTGAGEGVPLLNTDALCLVADGEIIALRTQARTLRAVGRARYRGCRAGADPVLGDVPLWFGPVEQEPADAH